MARKSKSPRKGGFETRTVYRDGRGRFVSRDISTSEETWTFRRDAKNPSRLKDLKIEALPFGVEDAEFFRSIRIPNEGPRAGKISAVLGKTLRRLGVSRYDTHIVITMTAKTPDGKTVKRKLDMYHYNSKKLEAHTIGAIMAQLFYEHGDRPIYPVKIVKGWRNRQDYHIGNKEYRVTKKATMQRRQLRDITFNIKTTIESRKGGVEDE